MRVLDIGCGDGQRGRQEFPLADVVGIDLHQDWDVEAEGLPEGVWDVLFAHHLIEHLLDVDRFLDRCAEQMVPGYTKLIIGMPNLGAWYNRLLFLFGYLPRCYEVSVRYNVGKPFEWGHDGLGGHLRVFTVDAFCELLRAHGFTITRLVGEASTARCWWGIRWVDRVLTQLTPRLASAFRVEVIRWKFL